MAIIDLDSGKILKDAEVFVPPEVSPEVVPTQQTQGRIINLDTGEFEAPALEAREAEQVAQAPETGFADIFTGSERIEATPELGTLPEFGTTAEGDALLAAFQGGDVGAATKISAGLLSTANPKAQMDIIQSAIPEAVFETTPDGSIIIEVPVEGGGTRRSVLNRPGFSPQDLTTAAAQVLSFIPAAKLAGIGKSLLAKMGIGGAAAGATEQALQEAGIALGREERDLVGTAIATVTGGLAEVVAPAIQAVRSAKQVRQVGAAGEELAQIAPNVKAAQEATEATGIPLFQAQQTVIPAQLEKQSFIATLPAGTQSAVKGLKEQNKATGDAVENFINTIAPPEAVSTGADKFRSASQAVLVKAKNIRKEKASPIYKEAFKEGAEVDINPVKDFIKSELTELPETGEISKSLKKISSLIKGKTIQVDGEDVVQEPSLKLLHNAKLEIDQMLNSFGSDSLGNTTKAKLTQAKDLLLQQMDEASPGYKAARDAFAEASPAVTKVQDSIIGKVAALDDTQLKQVRAKVFDVTETNPQVVLQAKKAIQDVDPEAWSQIVRVEIEKRLGSIKADINSETIENIPGQMFRALFPNKKGTDVLMAALDKEGKKNLTYLKTALGRAKLGRPGGSQTASREEIKKELRGGIFQSFRNFLKAPVSTVATVGEESAFNARAAAMSKALFDPTWKAEMKSLRALDPNSPAAARAMTQLLNNVIQTESGN